jgi:hypothetical protein
MLYSPKSGKKVLVTGTQFSSGKKGFTEGGFDKSDIE